jgi:hypothetical protein
LTRIESVDINSVAVQLQCSRFVGELRDWGADQFFALHRNVDGWINPAKSTPSKSSPIKVNQAKSSQIKPDLVGGLRCFGRLWTVSKFFKKALALYSASDSLRAPRRPKGRQDSMFADR